MCLNCYLQIQSLILQLFSPTQLSKTPLKDPNDYTL